MDQLPILGILKFKCIHWSTEANDPKVLLWFMQAINKLFIYRNNSIQNKMLEKCREILTIYTMWGIIDDDFLLHKHVEMALWFSMNSISYVLEWIQCGIVEQQGLDDNGELGKIHSHINCMNNKIARRNLIFCDANDRWELWGPLHC